MNEPGETGQKQSGPGFANALQACLIAGAVLVDGENNLATVTPEAGKILGFPADQSAELPIEALPTELVRIAREAMTSGKPSASHPIEVASEFQNDSVLVNAVPLRSGSKISLVVLTLHALSSNCQFQQQIRQLDRLANAGTLAAGMAHEIKNALVAGRTFLDLLLEKNADSDLVQVVRRETARIDSIVSRMLRFSATTASVLTPLHVHEVLEHALRLVQPQLNQNSIQMERSFKSSSDLVRGDEYELQQAFVNLLLNALEAMSPNGKLTVGTENLLDGLKGQRHLRVVIHDTGTGILPEHLNHLFEPFFTTKDYGTGLGLATTRRIVQGHGGTIAVESRPGLGTTFAILLPLVVDNSGTQLGGFSTAMLGKKG
jgi:signal transduction histidine kinase